MIYLNQKNPKVLLHVPLKAELASFCWHPCENVFVAVEVTKKIYTVNVITKKRTRMNDDLAPLDVAQGDADLYTC